MWSLLVDLTSFLWGTPLLVLMIGVGLYLTVRSGFFQVLGIRTWVKQTLGEVFGKNKSTGSADSTDGQLKPFQALSTVLAGTVGSGNIAGVASAIAIGGPGAVFWMWLMHWLRQTVHACPSLPLLYYIKPKETRNPLSHLTLKGFRVLCSVFLRSCSAAAALIYGWIYMCSRLRCSLARNLSAAAIKALNSG